MQQWCKFTTSLHSLRVIGIRSDILAQLGQYGRGSYREVTHNICPAGYNGQKFYACSSSAPDEGLIDHFVISDPSHAPESIEGINWLAANGQISEHAQFARIAHVQNQQIVQQQLHQYQAHYMAAQQYWALQQQLMQQRMDAAKVHYHSQFGNNFAQGWSLHPSGIPISAAYYPPKNYAPKSAPKTLKKTNARTGYISGSGSQQSHAGTSVYSKVSPTLQLEALTEHSNPKHFPVS